MKDRTGEVWELPTGTLFVVVGPPSLHKVLGWQHPALRLVWGENDDGPQVSTVQEQEPGSKTRGVGTLESRGWGRIA